MLPAEWVFNEFIKARGMPPRVLRFRMTETYTAGNNSLKFQVPTGYDAWVWSYFSFIETSGGETIVEHQIAGMDLAAASYSSMYDRTERVGAGVTRSTLRNTGSLFIPSRTWIESLVVASAAVGSKLQVFSLTGLLVPEVGWLQQ